jgi:glycosyltransferase involved in cell wall biosynthesis
MNAVSVGGTVHVVVPDSIDDPARPSGGNVYDRRICQGLTELGWSVHEHPLPGAWPHPDAAALAALTGVLSRLEDGTIVILDGLIASAAPELPAFARRLLLVVLVHMPLAQGRDDVVETRAVEAGALSAASAIVTTSAWTKTWLLEHYPLDPDQIHVVQAGADAAELAPGTAGGGQLLCVAAVTPAKGHDVLVAALAEIKDLSWACDCVGAADLDPGFVDELRHEAFEGGMADRIRFVGPRTGADLDAGYAAADVVVLCSRAETYGMVVTEALARGIPVIAAAVGGVPEALGYGIGTIRPGILVPPNDPLALAAALRRWLGDPELRRRLRRAASERRRELPGWAVAAGRLSAVLAAAGA